MGNGKEKKENDTLLYYIKWKFSGEDGKDICYEREGNKCFGEGIAEKNRGLEENWSGVKQKTRWDLERELNGISR